MSSISEARAAYSASGRKNRSSPDGGSRDAATPTESADPSGPEDEAGGADLTTEATVSDLAASAMFDAGIAHHRDQRPVTLDDALEAYLGDEG
ncbi:hypothetical protein [Aureimonas leprariae]|uniref:Uncharacterized protein n=1 Tax=Plantimonas leprariae TaxID=2615207 RepID=A0A7V7PT48_9HYPH|nr:hypothetical protein [Aureimonas leprariae]KAB0682753.1 hypothetical protein F6X38_01335 [Aureimonas leprariae]